MIGNFGWWHVQRSFDGVQYSYDRATTNGTVVALRPTRGVFDVNGWGELDIGLFYASVSRASQQYDWRIFASSYNDYRADPSPLKVDNRPGVARLADTRDITVHTIGAHYLRSAATGLGPVDVVLWGAAQLGDWGALEHRAFAFVAEAGL